MKPLRKEYYTITDIAEMTGLSTRTIRNYIKSGLLSGNKKDRAWIFSENQISQFFLEPFVSQSIQIKNDSIVRDFMISSQKKVNSVCSIFDYVIKHDEEVELLCNKIIKNINSKQYGDINFSFHYDNKSKIVRVIITGETELILKMMQKC